MSRTSTLIRLERLENGEIFAAFDGDEDTAMQFKCRDELRRWALDEEWLRELPRRVLLAFAAMRDPLGLNETLGEWRTCEVNLFSENPVVILPRYHA